MRNVPQPSQQTTSTSTKREDRKDAAHVSRVYSGKPSTSADRMFDLFENNAEVEIWNSEADDRLASSMYCGAKVLKKKKIKIGHNITFRKIAKHNAELKEMKEE